MIASIGFGENLRLTGVSFRKQLVYMESTPRELLNYETEDGKSPFEEWLLGLRDVAARAIIRKRLNRVRVGNLGNTRSLGS
jgi:hypothetical protein